MKLSDIRGEQAFDVLAEIIDPVISISCDPDAAGLFRGGKPNKGETARAAGVRRIRAHAPGLLRNHKPELMQILASINGMSVDDYAKTVNVLTLPAAVIDLLNDEAFKALFMSAAPSGAPSGAAGTKRGESAASTDSQNTASKPQEET